MLMYSYGEKYLPNENVTNGLWVQDSLAISLGLQNGDKILSVDENDFIHTEQFVLIDKERRIRGFYDGTEKEDMNTIKNDIAILKREYN